MRSISSISGGEDKVGGDDDLDGESFAGLDAADFGEVFDGEDFLGFFFFIPAGGDGG